MSCCRALWGACQELGEQRGCPAQLHLHNVASVEALQAKHGPFDGIVIAAGAAAGTLPEIGVPSQGRRLCMHQTSDLDALAHLLWYYSQKHRCSAVLYQRHSMTPLRALFIGPSVGRVA